MVPVWITFKNGERLYARVNGFDGIKEAVRVKGYCFEFIRKVDFI